MINDLPPSLRNQRWMSLKQKTRKTGSFEVLGDAQKCFVNYLFAFSVSRAAIKRSSEEIRVR